MMIRTSWGDGKSQLVVLTAWVFEARLTLTFPLPFLFLLLQCPSSQLPNPRRDISSVFVAVLLLNFISLGNSLLKGAELDSPLVLSIVDVIKLRAALWGKRVYINDFCALFERHRRTLTPAPLRRRCCLEIWKGCTFFERKMLDTRIRRWKKKARKVAILMMTLCQLPSWWTSTSFGDKLEACHTLLLFLRSF